MKTSYKMLLLGLLALGSSMITAQPFNDDGSIEPTEAAQVYSDAEPIPDIDGMDEIDGNESAGEAAENEEQQEEEKQKDFEPAVALKFDELFRSLPEISVDQKKKSFLI